MWPKLTEESVEIHKRLGYQAREYFESILVEELKASFRNEVLDRYGRALVNLWCREGLNSYNLTLVTA
ncbi:MAG: hypothetical protein HXS54_13925 [Theionarchaea archaeon]|nr:hypothetical protein [Theionarchaea archaeon]